MARGAQGQSATVRVAIVLGRPTLVGKALSFTHEFSFCLFFFYQSTALSSRGVDGHQMRFGGLLSYKQLVRDGNGNGKW